MNLKFLLHLRHVGKVSLTGAAGLTGVTVLNRLMATRSVLQGGGCRFVIGDDKRRNLRVGPLRHVLVEKYVPVTKTKNLNTSRDATIRPQGNVQPLLKILVLEAADAGTEGSPGLNVGAMHTSRASTRWIWS